MNDRELLEMAAKAAGYEVRGVGSQFVAYLSASDPDLVIKNSRGGDSIWNPLRRDGDALRLAVKLKLKIEWDGCEVQTSDYFYDSGHSNCACESQHDGMTFEQATRRAIVRCAAAIGEQVP